MTEMSRRIESERGVALIVVLSVLTMLLVIAAPFVLQSKKDYQNAATSSDRLRARYLAESALDYAKLRLSRTHQGLEAIGQGNGTRYWDVPDELRVDAHPRAWLEPLGLNQDGPPYMGDPRRDMWEIHVRDEQAYVNANSAPPFLWGALVGRGITTSEAEPSGGTLEVDSTEGFKKRRGEVVIDGEVFAYDSAGDGRISGIALRKNVKEGTFVLSKLAYDLAMLSYKSPRAAQGRMYSMPATSMVKEVAATAAPIPEERLDRVLGPLTAHSHRLSSPGWLAPQRVVAAVDPESFEPESGGQPVAVRNPDFFNPGTVVRLTDGVTTEYHIVTRASRGRDFGVVRLLEPVSRLYEDDGTATLTAEMRHPVNVNVCSREILVMLLDGIEYTIGGGGDGAANPNRVTREIAEEVADVIIKNRPVRGSEHLVELLSALFHVKRGSFTGTDTDVTEADVQTGRDMPGAELTLQMVLAIVQNALNPCFVGLKQSTMPFSYVSHDYFTVETLSSINDAGGTERARFRLRETFKTAPRQELRFRLDTQADFEDAVVAGRYGRFVETHPKPMSFFTGERSKPEVRLYRHLLHFTDPDRQGYFADRETGDVRLQPARNTTIQRGDFEEHFDGDTGAETAGLDTKNTGVRPEDIVPEGLPLTEGPYVLPEDVMRGGSLGGGPTSTGIVDALGINPFVIEFWMKPESFGAGPSLFSMVGDNPDTDFIRAYYDPADRSFHVQVHDNTVDSTATTATTRPPMEAAELVWTPPQGVVEDDTWYHFAVHVGGTKPEDVSLEVDGVRRRAESRYQSVLTRSFSVSDDSFEVEDAEGWPDEGAFLIGTEVVNATRTSGNGYQVFANPDADPTTGDPNDLRPFGRGARGTRSWQVTHPQGELVQVFGYSSPLRKGLDAAGEVLGGGGGKLDSDLHPFDLCAPLGPINDTLTTQGPNNQTITISVQVLDTAAGTIDLEDWDMGGRPEDTFQTAGGYAIIVGWEFPGTGTMIDDETDLRWIAQMIRYSSRSGSTLQGVSGVAETYNPQLVDGIDLGNDPNGQSLLLFTTTMKKFITRAMVASSGNRSAIFPISVKVDQAGDYHDPDFGSQSGAPFRQFVQLNASPSVTPSLTDFQSYVIEWVSYYGVDRGNNLLICHDRDALERAALRLAFELNNSPGVKPGAGSINGGFFEDPMGNLVATGLTFRAQAGTRQFEMNQGANVHSSGTEVVQCFRTTALNLEGDPVADIGDRVTVISEEDGVREEHVVAWAANIAEAGGGAFVALSSDIGRGGGLQQIAISRQGSLSSGYVSGLDRRRYTRLVKFPSGEMPNIRGGARSAAEGVVGADRGAQVHGGGLIDEVRIRGLMGNRFVLWDDSVVSPLGGPPSPLPIGVTDSDSEIPVVRAQWLPETPVFAAGGTPPPNVEYLTDGRQLFVNRLDGLPTDAGLALIDDEIVAYRGVNAGGRLENCIRGFLGTDPAPHSFGANVTLLDWRAVTRLTGQLDTDGHELAVQSVQDFVTAGGTLLVSDGQARSELLHYVRVRGQVMSMPRRVDRETGEEEGIFRGRYGTTRGSYGTDSIVVDFPFRYWDRYVPSSDDPALSFYELALNEPRSFLRQIDWRHRFDKARIGMKLVCRLDPKVPWDTPPDRSQGRLIVLESKSGRTEDHLNRHLLNVNGKGLEVRVFFTYEPNAFDPVAFSSNDWKETPRLLDLELRYLTGPLVLARETLR